MVAVTLREKLEALANQECNGADEYQDCAIHSLKAQAMARALLDLMVDSPIEFPWPEQLNEALDRADEIKSPADMDKARRLRRIFGK